MAKIGPIQTARLYLKVHMDAFSWYAASNSFIRKTKQNKTTTAITTQPCLVGNWINTR